MSKKHSHRKVGRNNKHLEKLGLDPGQADYVVALAGNPNTGKSTVFNSLTGLRQHTGNWPGKTVARAEGAYSWNGKRYKVVDLPGTYSLLSTSTDEEIARDFILFGRPDVTVIVADATRLERNLNLTLQILEITKKVVFCLNLMDEARRSGLHIDVAGLSRELGVPVMPTVARQNDGIRLLIEAVESVASGQNSTSVRHEIRHPAELQHAIDSLASRLKEAFPELSNPTWVALRLLEGDQSIIEAVRSGTFTDDEG